MAEDIRFEDFPIKSYFSKDLTSLLLGLTNKIPTMRLGHTRNGGTNEIKKHPFFKKIDWAAVLDKKMTPPIIPLKKVGDIKSMCGEDVNPYALLNQNFDKKLIDKEIDLYDKKKPKQSFGSLAFNNPNANVKTSFKSEMSNDSGHVSNFTYDQDFQSKRKIGAFSNCSASNNE